MHSTASDGGYSPSALMTKCKEAGLSIVSLTDHDTTDGLQEAKETADFLDIHVINGIELSTKSPVSNKSVHMLGYGFNTNDSYFQSALEEQRRLRKRRLHVILDKLNKAGMPIEAEDVLKHTDGGSIGRPHVAKALMEKGYVEEVGEAFDRYLGEGKPCFVGKEKEFTPQEAIELIHHAGGQAVVAHPVYYEIDEEIETWILDYYLDGVEVYHRDHDLDAVHHYEELVAKWEKAAGRPLIRTGGSDFHHEEYGRKREPLGHTTVPLTLAKQLIEVIS
nr:PHP domain-containing protein [Bacillus piscicola]